MPNDDRRGGDRERSISTVPPPAGESDIYEAKTQVGGLTPEALAMLKQLRDESKPPSTRASEEAQVPVFESEGKLRAAAPVRPSTEPLASRDAIRQAALEKAIQASIGQPTVPRPPAVPRDLEPVRAEPRPVAHVASQEPQPAEPARQAPRSRPRPELILQDALARLPERVRQDPQADKYLPVFGPLAAGPEEPAALPLSRLPLFAVAVVLVAVGALVAAFATRLPSTDRPSSRPSPSVSPPVTGSATPPRAP